MSFSPAIPATRRPTVTVATYQDIKVRRSIRTPCSGLPTDAVLGGASSAEADPAQACVRAFIGAKSRENPANVKPVGTGPYKFVDFKPGDMLRAEAYANYHVANQPFFDALELKGGGDALSAARAVLQTGEFDFAWNLAV
jgi:ABC-type transport system substrate-binding protein